MRPAVVTVAALGTVALLVTVASTGWRWAVAAWFGASALTFAVCTVLAGRAAEQRQWTELELIETTESQPSTVIERREGVQDVGRR